MVIAAVGLVREHPEVSVVIDDARAAESIQVVLPAILARTLRLVCRGVVRRQVLERFADLLHVDTILRHVERVRAILRAVGEDAKHDVGSTSAWAGVAPAISTIDAASMMPTQWNKPFAFSGTPFSIPLDRSFTRFGVDKSRTCRNYKKAVFRNP